MLLIDTVYIRMVLFYMIIVVSKFFMKLWNSMIFFFWCRVTPHRTPTIFPSPVKFSAFVLLRLSALWLSLLSYSIGNELLTFLAAPSPIFPLNNNATIGLRSEKGLHEVKRKLQRRRGCVPLFRFSLIEQLIFHWMKCETGQRLYASIGIAYP